MKIAHTMLVMFIGSFIIQYFVMPTIMVQEFSDITNNIGKAYMATIMGLLMILLEVLMHDHQYNVFSLHYYGFIVLALLLFVYLYKKQLYIGDNQYLEGMIEHHSMALLTSEEVLKKTNDYNIAKIAKNIIETQQDELQRMKSLLNK
jgi:hypothetical protein